MTKQKNKKTKKTPRLLLQIWQSQHSHNKMLLSSHRWVFLSPPIFLSPHFCVTTLLLPPICVQMTRNTSSPVLIPEGLPIQEIIPPHPPHSFHLSVVSHAELVIVTLVDQMNKWTLNLNGGQMEAFHDCTGYTLIKSVSIQSVTCETTASRPSVF